MLKNQIKEFYERVLNDVNFQNAMRAFLQEVGTAKATPEVTALVIKEVILPYSRNLGYNFSLKDLLEFENTEKVMVKVPAEELETISGGGLWDNVKRVGTTIYNRLPSKATVFKAIGWAGVAIGAAAAGYGLYSSYINHGECDADSPKGKQWEYENYGTCAAPSAEDLAVCNDYGPIINGIRGWIGY